VTRPDLVHQAQNVSASKWVVLKEWSGGSGHQQTEKFTTTGETWRVSWKTLAGDPDPIGSLNISVRTAAGRLVTMAANLGQKIDAGNFKVQSKPGEHYLEIESADRKWYVAVEHQ
jgi:hypothetical protein